MIRVFGVASGSSSILTHVVRPINASNITGKWVTVQLGSSVVYLTLPGLAILILYNTRPSYNSYSPLFKCLEHDITQGYSFPPVNSSATNFCRTVDLPRSDLVPKVNA